MRLTRATAILKRRKCARLEPQPLRIDRTAPHSSHSHFEKTEMQQNRAATILKRKPRLNRLATSFKQHSTSISLLHRRRSKHDSSKENDTHVGFSAPNNLKICLTWLKYPFYVVTPPPPPASTMASKMKPKIYPFSYSFW